MTRWKYGRSRAKHCCSFRDHALYILYTVDDLRLQALVVSTNRTMVVVAQIRRCLVVYRLDIGLFRISDPERSFIVASKAIAPDVQEIIYYQPPSPFKIDVMRGFVRL
jgi:hypothetical protein